MNQFYKNEKTFSDGESSSDREISKNRIDWKRIAYADIMRYRLDKNETEREERRDRVAELLGLPYFKRKDNDRCSIER